MKRAVITGIEGYVPDYVLTNAEIESMVDTSDQWIRERTGIIERRILKEDGLGISEMGTQAVEKLLQSTGVAKEEIDMVVCATVTPDMLFPATANIISDKVGIKNAWGFDLNAGCSGFIYAFSTVAGFIETGRAKKIVLVCGERLSAVTDYTDRNTCPLFGDAAVAMLIEPTEEPDEGLVDYEHHVDGIGRQFLYLKAGGSLYPATHETIDRGEHHLYQDGKTVFKYAVSHMADVSVAMMERHNLTANDIAYLIPHQANLRILSATGHRMGLADDKILVNIDKYGNTGGTSIPLVLWDFKNRFKQGDNLIISAFGAGFTWGALYYKWGKQRVVNDK
jgi:3-oxoacyl-[acyl-carrier-protein] synthase-3